MEDRMTSSDFRRLKVGETVTMGPVTDHQMYDGLSYGRDYQIISKYDNGGISGFVISDDEGRSRKVHYSFFKPIQETE